jgi:hypothetical protein
MSLLILKYAFVGFSTDVALNHSNTKNRKEYAAGDRQIPQRFLLKKTTLLQA